MLRRCRACEIASSLYIGDERGKEKCCGFGGVPVEIEREFYESGMKEKFEVMSVDLGYLYENLTG